MARVSANKRTAKEGYTFLQRLYVVLPWVLFSVVLFNLWFVFSYVRRERVVVDGVRDRVLDSVSNALYFVHRSLSNDIISARLVISNDLQLMRSRMLALSSPVHLPPSNVVSTLQSAESHSSAGSLPPIGDVPGSYFVSSGLPMLEISGSYFSVGDDFGLGSIESLSKMFVVCDGRRYRLSLGRSSPFPSFSNRQSYNPQPFKKEEFLNE